MQPIRDEWEEFLVVSQRSVEARLAPEILLKKAEVEKHRFKPRLEWQNPNSEALAPICKEALRLRSQFRFV
jgi:hypothetical protein